MEKREDGRSPLSAGRAADASHSSQQAVSTIGGIPNATHTPGPWRLHTYNNGKLVGWIQGTPEEGERYGRSITNYRGISRPASDEAMANALLIAAAPDLCSRGLALCEVIGHAVADPAPAELTEALDEFRAALAKALGDSL